MTRNIIGSTRTIQSAVLVCEYLKKRLAKPHSDVHPDFISYSFKTPTEENGFWMADIIVTMNNMDLKTSNNFVDICRAFVAGRGEIWT